MKQAAMNKACSLCRKPAKREDVRTLVAQKLVAVDLEIQVRPVLITTNIHWYLDEAGERAQTGTGGAGPGGGSARGAEAQCEGARNKTSPGPSAACGISAPVRH